VARKYANEEDILNQALMIKYGCNLRTDFVVVEETGAATARQGGGLPDPSRIRPICGFLLCLLACIFAFPIMYIVFSHVFPWGEMERMDESGETRELTCHNMYPRMMRISGYFQIAFVTEGVMTAVMLCRQLEESLEKKIWVVKGCFALALLVINFMMWYYLFESNKECGEQLWNFGYGTFVLFLFQFCQEKWASAA
jgi:hypothetical protein